jgi:hypothetical protein
MPEPFGEMTNCCYPRGNSLLTTIHTGIPTVVGRTLEQEVDGMSK